MGVRRTSSILLTLVVAWCLLPPLSGARAFDAQGLDVRLVEVVDGLNAPIAVRAAPDGSGRMIVAEQDGLMRVVRRESLRERPFLDLSSLTSGGGERGLLGLAFHPGFERNRKLYVFYTAKGDGDLVISEYKVYKGRRATGNPKTARVLLSIPHPQFGNHNGGWLEFGPDGYLYIATGDGGGANDPFGNGQRLDTLLGKILRISVTPSGGDPYTVPEDNPFVGEARARPEIWHYGLRNPWRAGFDDATGELWIGDVGQNQLEEIDRAGEGEGGINWGWSIKEGDECFGAALCETPGVDLRDPIAVYDHSLGCAVTGGYVYRGTDHPVMQGGYFFADYCSGIVFALDSEETGVQEPVQLLDSNHSISAFGLDATGELYALSHEGALLRLQPR